MAPDQYLREVQNKAEALCQANFWSRDHVRYSPWLHQFSPDDQVIAALVLDNFIYFSDRLTERLLMTAFMRLALASASGAETCTDSDDRLEDLREGAIFTAIRGESPNPTDSGYGLLARLRSKLDVPQEHILDLEDALSLALKEERRIVLVDDFIGTGGQFRSTWTRECRPDFPKSLGAAASIVRISVLALVAVEDAVSKIRSDHPTLEVAVPHLLGEQYRVANWKYPEGLGVTADSVREFLRRHAQRLDLEPRMLEDDFKSLGFGGLGIAVGFQSSVPDHSLPVIWADGVDWQPLARKG